MPNASQSLAVAAVASPPRRHERITENGGRHTFDSLHRIVSDTTGMTVRRVFGPDIDGAAVGDSAFVYERDETYSTGFPVTEPPGDCGFGASWNT